jgi:hypothetical protein
MMRRWYMRSRIDYVYYAQDEGTPYTVGGRYTMVKTPDHQPPRLIENLPHGDYIILRYDRVEHDGTPLVRISLKMVR